MLVALLALPGVAAAATGPQEQAEDVAVLKATRRCLRLFAEGNKSELRRLARTNGSFEARLFSSYLLFRQDPVNFRAGFLGALPGNEAEYRRYARIPAGIAKAPDAIGYQIRSENVPWPIGFWDIQEQIVALAVSGNRVAIKTIIRLSGHGDGEIGAGLSEDRWKLFLHPRIVAANWDLFSPRLDDFGSVRSELDQQGIAALRRQYEDAFRSNPKALRDILHALEHSER
jgi:hypothetical protein